jgi:hypothetical protein
MDSNNERRSFETSREHLPHESHNLLDDRISLGQERVSIDSRAPDHHDNHQDFSIPPTPTFQNSFQSHHNSGIYDSSRQSIRSYSSNHPYIHVNQDSFYNTLQDNIRHYSIQSSSVWTQSRSSTPVNDSRHLNYSGTWGSTANLMKDENPSPYQNKSFMDQMEKGSDSGIESPTSSKPPAGPAGPPGPPAGPPAIKFSKQHEILFIANVCMAQLLSLACLAQTVSPLLIIADSLGVEHPGQLAWLTASYSMSLGTFIVPAGKTPPLSQSKPT